MISMPFYKLLTKTLCIGELVDSFSNVKIFQTRPVVMVHGSSNLNCFYFGSPTFFSLVSILQTLGDQDE